MNKRIQELERLAEKFVMSIPASLDINEYTSVFNEKFAELIVKECLSIVEPTEDSGDEWCVTLKGTAQEIKQHFGVEE